MKPRYIPFLILLAVLPVLSGCAHRPVSVAGTWEMIYPEPEASLYPGGAATSVKILNDTHFAFGMMMPDGSAFAGGGRYSLNDSTYIETIRYHSNPILVGRSLVFHYRLEGDKWYHFGSFEVGGMRYSINEIWRRIDAIKGKPIDKESQQQDIAIRR